MDRFNTSIESSLKNQNWFAALFMDLAMPDICVALDAAAWLQRTATGCPAPFMSSAGCARSSFTSLRRAPHRSARDASSQWVLSLHQHAPARGLGQGRSEVKGERA